MSSMSRDPRCDEYTICAGVAPKVAFMVRTYADTRPPYGPALVRNFSDHEQRMRSSATRRLDPLQSVAEVRTISGRPDRADHPSEDRQPRLSGMAM